MEFDRKKGKKSQKKINKNKTQLSELKTEKYEQTGEGRGERREGRELKEKVSITHQMSEISVKYVLKTLGLLARLTNSTISPSFSGPTKSVRTMLATESYSFGNGY